MTDPALAPVLVIVASIDASASIGSCLAAIEAQLAPQDSLLVVDASRDGTRDLVRRTYPRAGLIGAAPGTLAPQLWRDGLASTAQDPWDIVVLTTAHCVPDGGWLSALRAALGSETTAAAGGAIEPGTSMSTADWGIYLQRYSASMLPLAPGPVEDVAGDNAAYRRTALDDVKDATADLIATGFWEPFVHAPLRQHGWTLIAEPEAVVRFHRSHSVGGFCLQRFRHGRYFGAWRTMLEGGSRLRGAAVTPLVPPLLLCRIGLRVRHKGRHGREFVRAAPLLLLFLSAWAAGELVGIVLGAPGVPRKMTRQSLLSAGQRERT